MTTQPSIKHPAAPRGRHAVTAVTALIAMTLITAPAGAAPVISYLGALRDVSNYGPAGSNIGQAGYWFPRFGLSSPQTGLARDSGAYVSSLPLWATFDYSTGTAATFSTQAGGVGSTGGNPSFATIVLPDGSSGLSGSAFDPQAVNNSNNTISRIQLGASTPGTFYFGIVADNAAGLYNSAGRVRARGTTAANVNIDPATFATGTSLTFNGVPDVYVFRYDGFTTGDSIKLQLNSGGTNAAGFGGLLFDTANPLVPEPSAVALMGCGIAAVVGWGARVRKRGRLGRTPG